MDLIYIYGAPGVGKLTVAQELSRLTGIKVFHNHLTIDCVLPVFKFGEPGFDDLVRQLRIAALGTAASAGISVIFTYVYGHPEDVANVEQNASATERHGGRVCFVQLTCRADVHERRVQAAKRTERGKIDTVERLHAAQSKWDLNTPIPNRESLCIDNTDLSPLEVAHDELIGRPDGRYAALYGTQMRGALAG